MERVLSKSELVEALSEGIPGMITVDGYKAFSTDVFVDDYTDIITDKKRYMTIDAWIKILAKDTNNNWTAALVSDSLVKAKVLRRVYRTNNNRVMKKRPLGFEPHENFKDSYPGFFISKNEVGPYTTSADMCIYALPFGVDALVRMNEIVVPLIAEACVKILARRNRS